MFILLNIKNVSKKDPDLVFLGHPDPDPDFANRICGSGSEKNGPHPQHCNTKYVRLTVEIIAIR